MSKRADKSIAEKTVSWIIAFALVLQASYAFPLTAYATNTSIVAYKIVCTNESDLPNWGAGGPDITSSTASQFLASHPNCHAQSGWRFQIAPSSTANPGDAVGVAPAPWITTGATNATGKTSISAHVPDFGGKIWVREVVDSAYIPFTGVGTTANVSAEMYCHTDVLNYDNFDNIVNPQIGSTYYCVAFNVLKNVPPPPPEFPYCGDGVIDQAWEECDGGQSCTQQCQTVDNQCSTDIFARVNVSAVSNVATGNMTNKLYVGSASAQTPSGAWFPLRYNGVWSNDASIDTYEDVAGLAVGRDTNGIRVRHYGSHIQALVQSEEHTEGNIEFFNATPSAVTNDAGQNKLEGWANGLKENKSGEDEAWLAGAKSNYWLTVSTADDGYRTTVSGIINSCEPDPENTKPVITLRGANPLQVALGGAYSEPSADVQDLEDGDIDANLVVSGVVNTGVVGSYTITYNAMDSKGLSADTKTRTVNVVAQCADGADNDGDTKTDYPADSSCDSPEDDSENSKPVITLRDVSPYQVTLGDTYTEPSADVDDAEDGDIDANLVVTGSVNTAILGAYTITYNAMDSKSLAADTKTRTVNVVAACSDGKDNDGDTLVDYPLDLGCDTPNDNDENTKPVITLDGANPLNITEGGVFTEPGFSANDAEDGVIPNANVVVTGTVDTSIVGTYTLSYDVVDSKGLSADTKTRTIKVTPHVTECNDGIDNDGDGSTDFGGDAGCDTPEDNDENQPPVITVVGADPFEVQLNTVYSDPGRTAADPEDLDITASIVDSGDTVNTAVLGTYVVKYNVTDSKGLSAVEKTRTIKVVTSCSDGKDNDGDTLVDYPLDPACTTPEDDSENSRPVISLLGDMVMSIVRGTTYTEPSATVADAEDGDITSKLVTLGTVDTNTIGAYTITYNATDSEDLAAVEVTRTVNVTTPPCTSNCGGGGTPPPVCSDGGDNDGDGLADFPRDPGCDSPQDDDEKDNPPPPPPGGGGPTTLTISNEKVVSTGTTTVLVTWNTNLPSDSRVAYGLDPVSSLGGAPLYGYSLTTVTDSTTTTSHSVSIEGVPSAVSAYFRPVSTASAQTAIGIELTRGGVLGESTECYYLKEYMRLGANNNPVEVTKLQSFLHNFEGFDKLEINGFFDIATDKAVRAFQDKYSADVLNTWNLPTNTGYVYYTTQKKINEIYCQRAFPLSTEQLSEIAQFRTVVLGVAQQTATLAGASDAKKTATKTPEASIGIVAGASTVAVSTEGEVNVDSVASESRGRIALADLLAISPTVGEKLSSTKTDPVITVEPITDVEGASLTDVEGVDKVASAGGALKDNSGITNATLIGGALFIVILTALGALYVRGRKTEVVVEMGE